MLAPDDGFAEHVDAVATHIWPAQVVQEHGPHLEVGGGTALRLVLVTDDEQSHR
jgi:hypothetical protein